MNGDIDSMDRVDLKTINLFKRNPNINIMEATGTAHYTFPMRLSVAPFDNYDLRMALKHSIKRQELVDKVLLGYGAVGNDHPISTANAYHNSDMPQRELMLIKQHIILKNRVILVQFHCQPQMLHSLEL